MRKMIATDLQQTSIVSYSLSCSRPINRTTGQTNLVNGEWIVKQVKHNILSKSIEAGQTGKSHSLAKNLVKFNNFCVFSVVR